MLEQPPEPRARRMTEGDPNQHYVLPVRDFSAEGDQQKAIVMRYLTFEKFVLLLELEAMWFLRLGALQDKFEGTLPKKARERLMARDRLLAEKMPHPELQPLILRMTDNGVENGRCMGAVNCWFLGKEESEEMWRLYGHEGKGIAIRSTVKRLSVSFRIPGDYCCMSIIGRVQYVDFDSHDMTEYDANNAHGITFIKEKGFAHEQEVRIFTLNSLHSGCLNPDGSPVNSFQMTGPGLFDSNRKGFYVKCRLQELIQAVVIGPYARPHFFTLVNRLIARYRLFVPIERSQLSLKS
jgi:hypothetical protein